MNKIDRYKILIRYAKENGFIKSQKDLAYKMGYKDEVSLSQIINNKTREPKDFVQRICDIIPNINADWLATGQGEMLTTSPPPPTIHSAGDVAMYNSQIHHDNLAATLQRLTDEIAEQRRTYTELLAAKDAQIAQKDAQISQLLNLLSK